MKGLLICEIYKQIILLIIIILTGIITQTDLFIECDFYESLYFKSLKIMHRLKIRENIPH